MNFQIERQFTRDLAVTIGYLGVKGHHLSRTRDINLFPITNVDGTLNGSTVTYQIRPTTTRPNPNFGRISVFDSGADSIYNAGFLQVSKRYARNFQLQASYTWSKVIDSRPDATSVVVGSDDGKVAADTLNPNAERAIGDVNIKHRFVVSGVYDINYFNRLSGPGKYILGGWQLSSILQAQSGRPFNPSAPADFNNDGNSRNDRVPNYGRNSIIGPNFVSLDLRISKDIPLVKERVKLRLIGEAFNALNRANVSGLNTTPYAFTAATRTFTNTPPSSRRPARSIRAFSRLPLESRSSPVAAKSKRGRSSGRPLLFRSTFSARANPPCSLPNPGSTQTCPSGSESAPPVSFRPTQSPSPNKPLHHPPPRRKSCSCAAHAPAPSYGPESPCHPPSQ